MKLRAFAILLCFAGHATAADSFPSWAWTLSQWTVPFRSSPISWGLGGPAGTPAIVSPEIVTESQTDRMMDQLPSSGLFGKGWPSATQLDPSKYIEFGIGFAGETPLFIEYVQLPMFREAPDALNRGEHGPRRWVLRWNRDNFASDLGPEFDMSAINDRSEAVYRVELWRQQPITDPITFRLYGYDSPSSEGSGGLRVVRHKLYVSGGTRPPLFGIPPRITEFHIWDYSRMKSSVPFEGSYGSLFGLERSSDLQTWVSAGVADTTVTSPDNCGGFFDVSVSLSAGQEFFRVIQRQ